MSNSSSSGVSVMGVIQIVFIILKCLGVITWSWQAVFTPLWINLIIVGLVLVWYWLDDALNY